jgi:hypothetical protein
VGGLANGGGSGLGRAPATKVVHTEKGITTAKGRQYLYTAMQFRSLEGRRSVRTLAISAGQQRRSTAKLTITCRGEISGEERKMFPYQKGSIAFCLTPIRKGETGRVVVSMTVKAGAQQFSRTFRGVLRPA